jgi:peptide/nickel transport system permease protein
MRYLLRRLLQLIPTLLGIVTLTFVIIHAAPGGPLVALSGEFSTAEYQRAVAALYGLDRSLPEQYLRYLGNVLTGDLGQSYFYKQAVLAVVLDRLPGTLLLMLPSLALSSLAGIWLGLVTTKQADRARGLGVMAGVYATYAVPVFWLSQLLVLAFALHLGWFPVQGMRNARLEGQAVSALLDMAYHLVLPVLALSLHHLSLTTVVTRARVREEMRKPYFLTALAKGLGVYAARRGHALRNALLPIVTVIGGRIGFIFAGAVLVETVFSWPGLGRLVVSASLNRDYPLLLGLFLCISAMTLIANLVTDLLYPVIDPRIRQGESAVA